MKASPRRNRRERGSILVLVIITMALLSTFAVSTAENSTSIIHIASDERDRLHSRLAADSAIAYTQRQLSLDRDWAGTGDWVNLGGSAFHIQRLPGDPGAAESGFVIGSASGDAQVALKADFVVMELETPVIDHAVAFLGGDADFNNVDIDGDLLVVDTEGGVYDYNPISGNWEARESGGTPLIESNNNSVTGDVQTTSGSAVPGLDVGGAAGSAGPVPNPTWNLDGYLEPNPDTLILYDVTEVKNLTTEKTVVIVNDPGTSVEFKKCDIGGGVVMWAPPEWPQRGPARNEITWTQSQFGTSGGGAGTYRHVGVLAPASRLDKANAANPGHGLFYFHEIGHMNNATIHGALWVVNDTGQWNNVDVIYEEGLAGQTFKGMEAELSFVEMVGVSEFHAYFPERD